MRKKFIDYAQKLLNTKDFVQIYSDLSELFDKQGLYHESGACLEKLWHVTQQPELYWKVGNIFSKKIGNPQVAFSAYNRYFQTASPSLWKEYTDVLEKLGYRDFYTDLSQDNYSNKIVILCDVLQVIIYMIISLNSEKDFDGIVSLIPYFEKAKDTIKEFEKTNTISNDFYEENTSCENHLSELLSENYHRNDINRFAIKLNPKNQKAYINIIDDLLTYQKYPDAIRMYNSEYAPTFLKPNAGRITDLCWMISDYYRDIFDFYKAVYFQKLALELELGVE